MCLARLIAAPATQRPADFREHGKHRIEIDDVGMSEDLERMLQLVGEQRNQSVVIDARTVRRHYDTEIASAGRWHDEGQQTAIQVAKRAMAEFDIHDAVQLVDAFEQPLKRRGSGSALCNECRY